MINLFIKSQFKLNVLSIIYIIKPFAHIYIFICSYSWPNGWTKWTEFFRKPRGLDFFLSISGGGNQKFQTKFSSKFRNFILNSRDLRALFQFSHNNLYRSFLNLMLQSRPLMFLLLLEHSSLSSHSQAIVELSRYSFFIYLFIFFISRLLWRYQGIHYSFIYSFFSFLGYFGAIKAFIIHLLIHSFIPRLFWSYQCIHYSLIYSIISFLGFVKLSRYSLFIILFIHSFIHPQATVELSRCSLFIHSLIHSFILSRHSIFQYVFMSH